MIHVSPDRKGIVWLASYPKSGNTWLRIFLYHVLRLQNGAPLENDELNHLDRASTYEGRLVNVFSELLGKPVKDATIEETARVRPFVQAAIANRLPSIALVKTHNCMGEALGAPMINPKVTIGAIYLARDPRDVAVSLAHHLGATVDDAIEVMHTPGFVTENAADAVFEVWGSWSEHVWGWTSVESGPLLVIRYEDMVRNPVGAFTKVIRHLRQEVSPKIIAEAARLSSFDRLKSAEKNYKFKETSERADHFFREGKAAAWRDKLTAEQAARIEAAHGDEMRRWGYLPADGARPSPTRRPSPNLNA